MDGSMCITIQATLRIQDLPEDAVGVMAGLQDTIPLTAPTVMLTGRTIAGREGGVFSGGLVKKKLDFRFNKG